VADEPSELTYPGAIRMRCVDPPVWPDFWMAMAVREWEPHTVAALVLLTGPGKTFLDIGGWIGLPPSWRPEEALRSTRWSRTQRRWNCSSATSN
jgi:hypothetical protein